MPAVSTLILRSMRMIGEKARGETLDANEAVECLAELNTFMEAAQTERLMCYSVTQVSTNLSASTVSYTIGTNGAFAVARPTKIVDPCFVRDSSGYDTPLTLIDSETYGLLVDKNVGYTYPTKLYYDYGYSNTSTGTLYVYPSPTAGLSLYINTWTQLQSFAHVSTQVLLPPGYQLFIESNFAIHLAAGLTNVSPEVAKIARDSKMAIKSLNIPDLHMAVDAGLLRRGGSRGSILTGP